MRTNVSFEFLTNNPVDFFMGVGLFMGYFISALIFLVLFIKLYVRMTPYDELKLISEGKLAPAYSLSGSFLGFCLPIASSIANMTSWTEMMVWALLSLVIQLVAYRFFVKVFYKDLPKKIEENNIAAGMFLGAFSLAAGILSAVSFTY